MFKSVLEEVSQSLASVKAQKYEDYDTLKVPTAKRLIMQNGLLQTHNLYYIIAI